ncbi:MAG: HU family DNA-binding protein [candidate division KSB1 bacterium]|nr:HU family DNA-binding protein [candidate division KSB1 bacterium]
MTKGDIVNIVAEGTGLTKKETAAVIDGFLATIVWALQRGQRVTLVGFGTFRAKHRPPRLVKNPRTGRTVALPERTVPIFVPSRELRSQVNAVAATEGEVDVVDG